MKHWLFSAAIVVLLSTTACSTGSFRGGQTFALGESLGLGGQQVGAASDNSANNASSQSGLINMLVDRLGISSQQALGGAGAVFALAQQHMSPADFMVLSGDIPDMSRYLSAVPQPVRSSAWLGVASGGVGEENVSLGRLRALTGSFRSLGMDTNMIGQFMPVVLQYVREQSGPGMMSLLQRSLY